MVLATCRYHMHAVAPTTHDSIHFPMIIAYHNQPEVAWVCQHGIVLTITPCIAASNMYRQLLHHRCCACFSYPYLADCKGVYVICSRELMIMSRCRYQGLTTALAVVPEILPMISQWGRHELEPETFHLIRIQLLFNASLHGPASLVGSNI